MRESIRDIDRLRHILEQIDSLQALMPELSFDNLDKDKVRYYGIVRHYLVHEYYQVSKESLWDTLTNDLPELRPFVAQYINELMDTK